MYRSSRTMTILACVLAAFLFAGVAAADVDNSDERKSRILANLKLKFPQLGEMGATMNDLTPSGFAGLDRGSFSVRNQQQPFLVASDDKQLFLINGETVDASRSMAEIEAELAKKAEEETRQAAERKNEIEAAIAGLPTRGNSSGKVTIVEFSDFQCPYCTRGANTVEQILEKYPNDVKFVFKHFPLGFHDWARLASVATICAGNQKADAFWTLHDKFFEHQKEVNLGNVLAKSKEFLDGSGIDMAAWTACAEDKDTAEHKAANQKVSDDMAFGQKMGVSGTPGFFVNGVFLNGAQPIEKFEPLIKKALSGS